MMLFRSVDCLVSVSFVGLKEEAPQNPKQEVMDSAREDLEDVLEEAADNFDAVLLQWDVEAEENSPSICYQGCQLGARVRELYWT
jgi:hypothetical protein